MGWKEIGKSLLIGGVATVGTVSSISVLVSAMQAQKLGESPWRCAYDGLRFPDEASLTRHIINTYKPSTPSDPRRNPPPAPMVFLNKLPNQRYPEADGFGLWRITIDHIRKDGKPMFKIETLKWWFSASLRWGLTWTVGWCGKGKIELATSLEGPWQRRGVTCRSEGDFPTGGFTFVWSQKNDVYMRIPELNLDPILIWKGK